MVMSGALNFRIEFDDGAIELFITFEVEAFSGKGRAWFSSEQIEEFIYRLSKCPLDDEFLPILSGGFWDKEGKGVVQEHVYILVTPAGSRGNLVLTIRLAEPTDDGFHFKCTASANMSLSYSEVSEISKGLRSLLKEEFPERDFLFSFKAYKKALRRSPFKVLGYDYWIQ
jgi:hypothetical protein